MTYYDPTDDYHEIDIRKYKKKNVLFATSCYEAEYQSIQVSVEEAIEICEKNIKYWNDILDKVLELRD